MLIFNILDLFHNFLLQMYKIISEKLPLFPSLKEGIINFN